MTPSADRIRVALAALETDAVFWTRVAAELRGAAAAARADTAVAPSAFSLFGGPYATGYRALSDHVVALLEDGAANAESTAAALRASAAAYAADDASGAHRLQGVY